MSIQSVTQLNSIPAENGVSATTSTLTIYIGLPTPDYNALTNILFGAYAQVNEDHDPRNDNQPRTTDAIALHPTGNTQGAYYFMSLNAGVKLHRDN